MERLLGVEASSSLPAVLNRHTPFNANGVYRPEEMLLICPAQTGRTTGPIESARPRGRRGSPCSARPCRPAAPSRGSATSSSKKPTG
ncbi:MAG: hypothetical protein ACLVL7_02695 [Anaerotruncus massiliensis (ex Togo et al. 2019)]